MNPPDFLARAGEKYFEPSESPDTGFFYGRFNPPCEHHLGVIDRPAEKYDLDEVYVAVVNSKNTPRSPMSTEQVIDALDVSFEERGSDYDLNAESYELEDIRELMQGDKDILDEDTVYYTGDLDWALVFDLKRKYSDMDFEIDYEHRETRGWHGATDLAVSGTQIKEMMGEGDERWRDYASTGAEHVIDENPEILERTERGDPTAWGKHLEVLLSRF